MFGHPKGLYVLFFTELWERFSFYGMKTLLVLYMINHFFWSQEDASHLLGTYSALAYGLPVIGGFLADRYLGARRAVIIGAVLLSIGHFVMAFEPKWCFYSALGLIIAGVAFLKPNVSTQVGSLYRPGDPRRDGAFTIFYMGINLGALIGPLICDWLRQAYGYHYGFGAAGVGMVFGLIVYVLGRRTLVEYDQDVPDDGVPSDSEPGTEPTAVPPPAAKHAHSPRVVIERIIVLLIVFAFVILFWTAFEQSPNAMLVWADKHTNLRMLSTEPPPVVLDELTGEDAAVDTSFGERVSDWFKEPSITSGQTQSINPLFIILLAPIFAALWIWLDKRKLQPSTPTKMAIGLCLVGVAFGVMWPAAQAENKPTTAALASLPSGLDTEANGQVYTVTSDEEGHEDRTYFGATRLQYDAERKQIVMSGVLSDLDRFRVLAATAPPELVTEFDEFSKRTAEASADAEQGDTETPVTTVLATMPESVGALEIAVGEGASRETILTWDPATRTLSAMDEIGERARIEFLAAAAQPDLKKAIDNVYIESAKFRVSVWWLIAFFMVLTMGELCLSPVGLSLVTKLAPPARVGLFMGGWFLATAIAEYTAQVFGAYWGKLPPDKYFLIFVVMCGIGAFFMALLIRPLKRMMHGVQ